jgi:hypothetical protein
MRNIHNKGRIKRLGAIGMTVFSSDQIACSDHVFSTGNTLVLLGGSVFINEDISPVQAIRPGHRNASRKPVRHNR